MYLLRLAARNVFRRSGRTLIISSILMFAIAMFILFESLMVGLMDVSFNNVIDFEIPHIEVAREGYFAESENSHTLPVEKRFIPDDQLVSSIEQLEGFQAMTGILEFSADFISGRYEFPVRVRAIDTATFDDVFKNSQYVVDGKFLDGNGSGVVMGSQLAEFFDLEVGDFFIIRFTDLRGSFNTMEGQVSGIVTTPHPEINLTTVFVNREHASPRIGVDDNAVTQMMVRLDHRDGAGAQTRVLTGFLGDSPLQARSYREGADFLVSLEEWGYLETYFMLALFLIVGVIGIVSAVVLAAIEREREIGMMKSMGLGESSILKVFMFEAGGIGVVGGVLGCLVGAIIIYLFNTYGFNLDIFMDFSEVGVPISGRIYGPWNPSAFLLIFVIVVAVSMISSILPAYWAARKNPIDALGRK